VVNEHVYFKFLINNLSFSYIRTTYEGMSDEQIMAYLILISQKHTHSSNDNRIHTMPSF